MLISPLWVKPADYRFPRCLSVSLSVSPLCVCLLLVRALTSYCHVGLRQYSSQLLSITQGYVMTLTHAYKQVTGHTAYLPKFHVRVITSYCHVGIWIRIICHTIFVPDPRMCHNLDTQSHLQGLSHTKKFFRAILVTHSSCWIQIIFT